MQCCTTHPKPFRSSAYPDIIASATRTPPSRRPHGQGPTCFALSLLLSFLPLLLFPFFSLHFLVLMSGRQGFFIVDDNDSRVIDYSETPTVWFPSFTGSPDDAYQGTITSGLAGAKATMKFKGTLCAIV